jgi:AraC-like DNA-binding protein/mannose-6-phosphate isomerase-like protein (cupin superfamily)
MWHGEFMYWTFSEFLNVFELQGQCWCFVELGDGAAFRMPHADVMHFYAVLNGSAHVSGVGDRETILEAGEMAFVLSGGAHSLRQRDNAQTLSLPLLQQGGTVDGPPTISLGEGKAESRLLCGRLNVRWPGGQRPREFPPLLRISGEGSLVDLSKLLQAARGDGGSALLTRMATVLFVDALRNDPTCKAVFDEANQFDPIAQAKQFIELHPFRKWTVEDLARKVGMGRSNFAAKFSAEMGKTPIDVLTEERMKHAAQFLAKTDLKIAEVSERIGYRSEAAFHNRFTSHFGMSPGKMRREHRRQGLVA